MLQLLRTEGNLLNGLESAVQPLEFGFCKVVLKLSDYIFHKNKRNKCFLIQQAFVQHTQI